MEVIEDPKEMQKICERLRNEGCRISLVPTMGALHAGHMHLVEAAHADFKSSLLSEAGELLNSTTSFEEASNVGSIYSTTDECAITRGERYVVIVSIFVNPAQFNDPADYANYARTLESDIQLCREHKVQYVFSPSTKHMYRNHEGVKLNKDIGCTIIPPSFLANTLEGASRPGHFEGMLTVVNKLCNITKAHVAYFGEKDYQQLVLVTRMSQDLDMDVHIRPVPTVREADMLPLSSRNVRLNSPVRQVASVIYRLLIEARDELLTNSKQLLSTCDERGIDLLINKSIQKTLTSDDFDQDKLTGLLEVDYLELRCALDLSDISLSDNFSGFDCKRGCVRKQVDAGKGKILKARLLISIILDGVRLLDNIEIQLNEHDEEPS